MIYYVITLLSQIYCEGPILEAVQDGHLFPDSKHFVDMSLKYDPVTTLKNFHQLGDTYNERDVLIKFVEEHFNPPGNELEECIPEDWESFPSNFLKISDFHLRRWALHLHRLWRDLCRKVRDRVRDHQELYSLLYVPNQFIIPGGRFREFYYWDSYWILKGLLFSEMYETAKGMIWNLAHLVDNHGFVPNGGRVYYLLRSQPPLLTLMAYDYYLATGDGEFLQDILPLLEKEYKFWLTHRGTPHVVNGTTQYNFYRYKARMKYPRPESYREDKEITEEVEPLAEKQRIWSDIASAAETGWDFSSRWFAHDGEHAHTLHSIRTWQIVPVDLNAFMCINSRLLANMFEITGNLSKVLIYQERYEQAKQQIVQYHWNETDGIWYDYDLEKKAHVNVYYASNILPLFARCYDDDTYAPKAYNYLKKSGALNFTRGVPTSLVFESTQQWDKENAWPPMVHMLIEGLRVSGQPALMEAALELATNWLTGSYRSYIHTHAMFEKYNVSNAVSDASAAGGGGEYEVQTGFGWTNGVILDLLDKYGDQIIVSHSPKMIANSVIFVVAIISTFWSIGGVRLAYVT